MAGKAQAPTLEIRNIAASQNGECAPLIALSREISPGRKGGVMSAGLVLHERFDSTQQEPSPSTIRERELLVGTHGLPHETNACTFM